VQGCASSLEDEAEGFEKSLFPKVIRLEIREEPERFFDSRQRSFPAAIF
jgi:hypothetical protein